MKHDKLQARLPLWLFVTVNAPAEARCVDVNIANMASPDTNWNTASATIQNTVGFAFRPANPTETRI